MKKTLALVSLLGCFALIGCKGENEQTILRQAIINANGTYELAGMAAIPFLENKVPGVTLTQSQIATLKRTASIIADELESATLTIQKGGDLSQLTVTTIQTSLQAYVKCLKELNTTKKLPQDCVLDNIGG